MILHYFFYYLYLDLINCLVSDNLDQRIGLRKHVDAFVMVWATVTATGSSPLVFIELGVVAHWLDCRALGFKFDSRFSHGIFMKKKLNQRRFLSQTLSVSNSTLKL